MLPSNTLERIRLARDKLNGLPEKDLRAYAGCLSGEIPKEYMPVDQRLAGFTPTEKAVLVDEVLQSYAWQ